MMASKSRAIGTLSAALVIAFSTAGTAIAQTPTEPQSLDTITVVAPRITYTIRRDRSSGSAVPQRIEVAEKTALVSYADLDLARTADLYTLESRVDEAAARVCGELAQQFPEGEPSTAVCARRAADDAMAHVRSMARQMSGG